MLFMKPRNIMLMNLYGFAHMNVCLKASMQEFTITLMYKIPCGWEVYRQAYALSCQCNIHILYEICSNMNTLKINYSTVCFCYIPKKSACKDSLWYLYKHLSWSAFSTQLYQAFSLVDWAILANQV